MLEILSFSDQKRVNCNENERANFGGEKAFRGVYFKIKTLNALLVVVLILESKALYSRTQGIIFYLLNTGVTRLHC